MSYYVYILANRTSTVLYTGFSSDLLKRVHQHKEKLIDGFTKRYNVTRLVYYEMCGDVLSAMAREKQIKGGSRNKKMEMITQFNPTWRDLYETLLDEAQKPAVVRSKSPTKNDVVARPSADGRSNLAPHSDGASLPISKLRGNS